ncbi:MAG TPA: thioredoxin [Candidatus Nitrosocosmicus sp.]|nr:thioredoxin [Candidatus Nitrosocosmicus sp.]
MAATHINQSDFQKEVLDHKGIVMVDFYAEWCGPCKMTSPIIDELADEKKDIKFVKIDVDQNSDLASQYNIFSIPTFMIFKDGKPATQFAGAQSKDGFVNELQKVS